MPGRPIPDRSATLRREPTIQRVDAICDEFESRWQDGQRPSLSEFLDEARGVDRDVLLRELLAVELEYRRQRSDVVSADEYRQQFPDAAGVVTQVFNEFSTVAPTRPGHAALQEVAAGATSQDLGTADDGPTQFGDYELLEEIARGGMGVVYRARQKQANRVVALKMILSGQFAGEEEVQRFRSEAEAAARLDHPHIVPVFDVGEHEGQHYFSMGYVDGESLTDRLHDGPLPPQSAAQLVRSTADAIACAHEHGVIHRDLKPSNVLIDRSGKPRVTDFGLAKHVGADSNLTATGQVMGTPSYMPPEQAAGEVTQIDERSDVYSLGAILYTLVTGRPPFQAAQIVETLRQVIDDNPVEPRVLNPAVDRDLETICLKCLEKDPARRYQRAQDLIDELDRYLSGRPIVARAITRRERLWRWCRRQPLVAGLIATAVASLVIGTGVSIYFAVLAQQRAEHAQQGTRVALTALETVINTVQNKLRDIPAAQEIRRELLRDSLESLQQVSGELQTQSRVDRDTAVALVDLAQLFVELGDDEGFDSTATAETNFKAAVDIFHQIVANDEQDESLLIDQSWAFAEYGSFLLNRRRMKEAEPLLAEALSIRRQLAVNAQNDAAALHRLATSLNDWADLAADRRDFEGAIVSLDEAAQLAERAVKLAPDHLVIRTMLGQCYEKLGDAHHDLQQNDEALEYFQRSFDVANELYRQHPNSSAMQDSLSYAYERLGNHWLQVGDPEQALEMYERMREMVELAIENDPANRTLKAGLADACDKVATACSALQRHEAAADARSEAGRIRQELARTEK